MARPDVICLTNGVFAENCYILADRANGDAVLVDPGEEAELFLARLRTEHLTLRAIWLTHAHIDHSGLLPKLCAGGSRARILPSEATKELLSYRLPASGHTRERGVGRLSRRNARRGLPAVTPIYTRELAEACLQQIDAVPFDRWIEAAPGLRARLWNAGHILGSASIEVEIASGKRRQRFLNLLFSGDLGPGQKPFHPDPDAPESYDYMCVESTYGNRDRPELSADERRAMLRDEVRAALDAGGNLLIPAFAVERTQELLYDLALLFHGGEIPPRPVYLDSPLAIHATEVFARNLGTVNHKRVGPDVFRNPNFHFVESAAESAGLQRIASGAIIMAGSGMCDAGRIRAHLKDNLYSSANTVLLVGYQAPGTLGSLLLQGARSVRIHGEEIRVAARIRMLDIYSGHADRRALARWVAERLPVRRGIFLTHGEEDGLMGLRDALIAEGCDPKRILVPRLDETVALDVHGVPKPRPEAPRLPAHRVGRLDWHNAYAAFLLGLQAKLRGLPDDARRDALVKRLARALAEGGRPGPGRPARRK